VLREAGLEAGVSDEALAVPTAPGEHEGGSATEEREPAAVAH